MRKIIFSLVFCLLCFTSTVYADSYNRIWMAAGLTGGTSGDLDGAVSGVSIGPKDTAIVADSGTSRVYFYKAVFDTSAENSPTIIRPDDVGGGPTSWQLAKIYIAALDVEGDASVTGYITGGIPITDITTGTVTLSGVSQRGGLVSNIYASSEVTGVFSAATKGDSAIVSLAKDMMSGSTLWVQFNSADKIINYTAFVTGTGAGTSYYYLSSSDTSGNTGEGISVISPAAGFWYIYESGSPSVGSK